MKYLTLCLDLASAAALIWFAFLLWPPLALLVGGGLALAASWSLTRKSKASERQ